MSYTPSTKAYEAENAINARRIVTPGTSDGQMDAAAASSDALVGVTTELNHAAGETVDVHHAGVAQVEAGGAITAGDQLTADANGKAVKAAPTGGASASVVGTALEGAASGDIIYFVVSPGQVYG